MVFGSRRSEQVHDFVKAVRDLGLLAGVSAHNPECIKRIADEGWQVDFFMTCFYFLTRDKAAVLPWKGGPAETLPLLDGPDVGYRFYKTDPMAMCEVIRQVKQPCLAFKILGAGRRCASQKMVREAFQFAFEQTKPDDAVIVGMYPRYSDQIRANTACTRRLAQLPQLPA